MAIKALSQRIPTLRLYQQIIIYVIVVIFIPLLIVHGVIYSINQKALKKELVKFTEHTAEIIYTDVTAQLHGQQEQVRILASLIHEPLEKGVPLQQAVQRVFQVSPTYQNIAVYNTAGNLLASVNNTAPASSPEAGIIPPPQQLPTHNIPLKDETHHPTATGQLAIQFYLQNDANTPLATRPHRHETTLPLTPSTETPHPHSADYHLISVVQLNNSSNPASSLSSIIRTPEQPSPNAPRYIRFQKSFPYLNTLIKRQNKKLNEGFYIIDASGHMLAGPPSLLKAPSLQNQREWKAIAKQLPNMSAGRTNIVSKTKLSFWEQTGDSLQPIIDVLQQPVRWVTGGNDKLDDDTTAPIEKVVIKLNDLNWAIILESPYSVRQKYVKRARNQTLAIIFLQFIVALGITIFYITNLRRNFRQLIKGIQALAEGKYSRRIRLIVNWLTPFELMYMTGEFNRMSRRRAEAWNESETLNQELRLANDKLAQLDEMKSNLIDTVSHELRTPLTSIKGYTNRLIRYDETLDKEMRLKSLKVIKRQADRLNRLVDDLLVIPELEQNHLSVISEPVELRSLLTRSVQSVAEKERDVLPEIKINGPTDKTTDPLTDWLVLADPDRLEQVMINLLDNAIKYAEENTPILVTVNAPDTNHWSLTVANECPVDGIPESTAVAQQLFEKFKRLDESTTRTTRGTGLGLYITKGLIEAMDGSINVTIEDTRFMITITLPAVSPVLKATV